ncbi:MAG: sulfide/dihydroorotate dehydrogenase-like FAD/NAD-binding protein [Candidatus Omnitrophica bacterium]|nr:sulfide/dihydroorotate dehydrogenase-like FAD/NAD-binding protein [Candidatus Omnitrophota bacterium]
MKIIKKEILVHAQSTRITQLAILAPDIAKRAMPGQFVVLMTHEEGERIPLTVVSKSEGEGTIGLIFQEVGLTTKLLGMLNVGDSLYALAGPLGHSTKIKNYGKVIIVGGGVGIAEIYPVAQALKNAGNHITTIIGARSKDIFILEEELKGASDELYITTDDGSYGRKGFTTDVLVELLRKDTYNLIYAVGPIPMMKKVSLATGGSGIKTIVSLNALMVDATGMCGCCRVTVAGKTKFSCVDGPEFDGHLVEWEELEKRNTVYLDKEKKACSLVAALNKK